MKGPGGDDADRAWYQEMGVAVGSDISEGRWPGSQRASKRQQVELWQGFRDRGGGERSQGRN